MKTIVAYKLPHRYPAVMLFNEAADKVLVVQSAESGPDPVSYHELAEEIEPRSNTPVWVAGLFRAIEGSYGKPIEVILGDKGLMYATVGFMPDEGVTLHREFPIFRALLLAVHFDATVELIGEVLGLMNQRDPAQPLPEGGRVRSLAPFRAPAPDELDRAIKEILSRGNSR